MLRINLNHVPEEIKLEVIATLEANGVSFDSPSRVEIPTDKQYNFGRLEKTVTRIARTPTEGLDSWDCELGNNDEGEFEDDGDWEENEGETPITNIVYNVIYRIRKADDWNQVRESDGSGDTDRVNERTAIALEASGRVLWLKDLNNPEAWVKSTFVDRIVTRFYSGSSCDRLRAHTKVLVQCCIIEGLHFNKTEENVAKFKSLFCEVDVQDIPSFHPGADAAGLDKFYVSKVGNYFFTNCGANRLELTDSLQYSEAQMAEEWAQQATAIGQNQVQEAKDAILDLRRQLTEAQSKFGHLKRQNENLKRFNVEFFIKLIADLKAFKGFIEVGTKKRSVFARTDDVWLQVEGTRRYIGQFDIFLHLNGTIQFKNIRQPTSSSKPHPHSWHDDSCLGTFDNAMAAAFVECDYFTAILTVYEFLNHINPNDRVASQERFPNFPLERPDDSMVKVSQLNNFYSSEGDW